MSFFSNLFEKKAEFISPLVDIHSHLLAGIDDGVSSIEESLDVIRAFKRLGYKKLITTPHVMNDTYNNTPEVILAKLSELRKAATEAEIGMELDAAAEYYL